MAYVDYAFYSRTYYGTAIEEQAFPRLCARSSEYIDSITFNRLRDNPELVNDNVRLAVCAVAETIQTQERINAGGGPVKSESAGKQSVTYYGASEQSAETVQELQRRSTAWPYLVHTGLLYRGV